MRYQRFSERCLFLLGARLYKSLRFCWPTLPHGVFRAQFWELSSWYGSNMDQIPRYCTIYYIILYYNIWLIHVLLALFDPSLSLVLEIEGFHHLPPFQDVRRRFDARKRHLVAPGKLFHRSCHVAQKKRQQKLCKVVPPQLCLLGYNTHELYRYNFHRPKRYRTYKASPCVDGIDWPEMGIEPREHGDVSHRNVTAEVWDFRPGMGNDFKQISPPASGEIWLGTNVGKTVDYPPVSPVITIRYVYHSQSWLYNFFTQITMNHH